MNMKYTEIYKQLRKEAQEFYDINYKDEESTYDWLRDGVYVNLCKFLHIKIRYPQEKKTQYIEDVPKEISDLF